MMAYNFYLFFFTVQLLHIMNNILFDKIVLNLWSNGSPRSIRLEVRQAQKTENKNA